jgi:hypothetical protein
LLTKVLDCPWSTILLLRCPMHRILHTISYIGYVFRKKDGIIERESAQRGETVLSFLTPLKYLGQVRSRTGIEKILVGLSREVESICVAACVCDGGRVISRPQNSRGSGFKRIISNLSSFLSYVSQCPDYEEKNQSKEIYVNYDKRRAPEVYVHYQIIASQNSISAGAL